MKFPSPIHTCGLLALAAIFTTSCNSGDESAAESSTPPTAEEAQIPDSLLAAKAPADARAITAAHGAVKPGEEIVLRGRVGGKGKPISDAVAVFVLADDEALSACDTLPGDSCPTPWDYCCEQSADIAASTATIQAKDADGKVLRASFRGLGGLKEHSTLVVAGTVDPASTPESLIVNATVIHVVKP